MGIFSEGVMPPGRNEARRTIDQFVCDIAFMPCVLPIGYMPQCGIPNSGRGMPGRSRVPLRRIPATSSQSRIDWKAAGRASFLFAGEDVFWTSINDPVVVRREAGSSIETKMGITYRPCSGTSSATAARSRHG